VVGHPGGEEAAVRAVRDSGLRVTGFQVLRDFEGLSGHLHAYKLDVAKAMLEMCRALGANVLLACSSTSAHATGDKDSLIRDLRKLALLAVPFGIRIVYEALSWGRHVNLMTQAWEIVRDADRSNLGICIDSYHVLAHGTDAGVLDALDGLEPGARVIVLTWLDRADRDVLRVHPRDDRSNPMRGVFSTRSADRPNPIGLHEVEVLAVEADRVKVSDLEALDGTPVVDLKPVI